MLLYKLELLWFFKSIKLVKEGLHILELTVYRGKSYVCYLINRTKVLHYKLTYFSGLYLALERSLYFILNSIDYFFSVYRTLLTSFENTAEELGSVKQLLITVLFYDDSLNRIYDLIGGKPFLTIFAFSSSSDAGSVLNRTGIEYIAFKMTACRTFHKELRLSL